MTTTQHAATDTPAAAPPPLSKPLRPAHPDAAHQPILVQDLATGTPTWVYPPPSQASESPRVDPMAQRIMAAGAAAPLIGWGGSMFFGAMAGATTGLGYAAVCAVSFAVIRTSSGGGKGGGNSISIRIDNRAR